MVGAAQRDRVDAEERREVVVAHVVEVPARRRRRAATPAFQRGWWIATRRRSPAASAVERLLVGDVGEGEALGGEAHTGEARVARAGGGSRRRRSSSRSRVGPERQVAPAGRRGDVEGVDARLARRAPAAARRRARPVRAPGRARASRPAARPRCCRRGRRGSGAPPSSLEHCRAPRARRLAGSRRRRSGSRGSRT